MHARFGRRVFETYICLAAARVTLIRPVGVFYPRAIRGFASVFELGLMVTLWVGPRRLRQRAHNQQRQDGGSCKLRDSHDGPHFKRFEYKCTAGAKRFKDCHLEEQIRTPLTTNQDTGGQIRTVPSGGKEQTVNPEQFRTVANASNL